MQIGPPSDFSRRFNVAVLAGAICAVAIVFAIVLLLTASHELLMMIGGVR